MSIQFKDLTKMIVFAKNEKGEIKLIDDVANGYECECFCLNCGGKLNAKNNGKFKSHHFAHANGSDCKKGHENTLPLFLQRVLVRVGKIVMPEGHITIKNEKVIKSKLVSVRNISLEKVDNFPSVVKFISNDNNEEYTIFAVLNDEMVWSRIGTYKKLFKNLIMMDLRDYQESTLEVEETIEKIICEKSKDLKYIKNAEEELISSKIIEKARRISLGTNVYGVEIIYCPLNEQKGSEKDLQCSSCAYHIRAVIDNCCENKCLGYLKHKLSLENILNSKIPDFSSLEKLSYKETHGQFYEGYFWFKLKYIADAYPERDYAFIKNYYGKRTFLVSFKSFRNNEMKGVEIFPDGTVSSELKDLIFFVHHNWRICGDDELKITGQMIEYLNRLLFNN